MRKLVARTAIVATAAVAVSGVGVAFAAWSASGVSNGQSENAAVAKAKTALSVLVTSPGDIYPTSTETGAITAVVSNTNPYAVTLGSASITGVSSSTAACEPALTDFTFGTPTLPAAAIARVSGTGNVSIPVTLVKNTLDDDCAGAPIAFRMTVGGQSS